MAKFDDVVKKQLDAVVGESYEPPKRWRATLVKWFAFAVLAVAMSAVVIGILHTHVMQAQTAPPPKSKSNKPIPIIIVPAK